jgi:hypothetical protein
MQGMSAAEIRQLNEFYEEEVQAVEFVNELYIITHDKEAADRLEVAPRK